MKSPLALASIAIACCLTINVSDLYADDAETIAKVDELLTSVQSIEFGGEANVAREFEQIVFRIGTNSQVRETVEQKLVDALEASTLAGRDVICRQLRVIGTDRCVAALAPMLSDAESSAIARYALEGIGSDKALQAMHDAMANVSGSMKLGILNSLANHDYQPIHDDCISLLDSEDSQVVVAAVRALGRFGGVAAIESLTELRMGAPEPIARDIDLALLACAQKLVEDGDVDPATRIYETLYKQGGVFHLAGFKGLVATRSDEAAALLIDAMKETDEQLAAFAANQIANVVDDRATMSFVNLLEELPEPRQELLVRALGIRGDSSATAAVAEIAKNSDSELRLAALEALGGLEGEEAIDVLLDASTVVDSSVRSIARASLSRIRNANAYLAELAQRSDTQDAMVAISTMAMRNATDQTELILKLARHNDPFVRTEAIRAIGVLANQQFVGDVLELRTSLVEEYELTEFEIALGRILMRIESPVERATPILNALTNAPDEFRPLLIRLLARAGTADALSAVRESLQSTNQLIAAAAVEALANWPNAEVNRDLIPLVENAPTDVLQTVALNGYIRIASESAEPSAMFLDLLNRVTSVDHQKRILNEIGLNCESFEAIEAAQSLFDDQQLNAVAAIAVVRIAYKLRVQHKDRVRGILENVLAQVDHPDVQVRAQDVLNDIDKYEDHILEWVAAGPFVDESISSGDASYRTVFLPELAEAPELEWKPLTLGISSWDINLEATYGAIDHCSAYVRTMIWSPTDQEIQVEGGSDDALKIWMNGEQIHEQWRTGGCQPRQVQAKTQLNEGWNELLLKVTDHEGGWQFGCRVRKPNGTALEGLRYEAR